MPLGIRRKRRWPLYLGAFVGACSLFIGFALVFGVGPYDLPAQSRRLEAVIEESKRLGLPMTQEDLKPEEPVPDDQNAAPDVVRLAEEFSRSQRLLDPSYLNLDTTERAELEEAVTKVGPHLDGIVTALETKPGWSIDRDYDLAPHLLFPEYANFKSVAKYLASRAVLRADGGDAEGAVRDLRAARDLRQRFASETVLIAFLVAVAIDAIALRASEEVMTAFSDDTEALGQIEAMLMETEHRIDPRPALRGEFYFALTMTRNLEAYGGFQAILGSVSNDTNIPQLDPDDLIRSGLPEGMFSRAFMASAASEWNHVFQSF